MEFELRSENFGPVFAGCYLFGSPIDSPWEPEVGNKVTLKSGEISIIVTILSASGHSYTGGIIGFESFDENEYKGKKPNDVVEFNYKNIISCMK